MRLKSNRDVSVSCTRPPPGVDAFVVTRSPQKLKPGKSVQAGSDGSDAVSEAFFRSNLPFLFFLFFLFLNCYSEDAHAHSAYHIAVASLADVAACTPKPQMVLHPPSLCHKLHFSSPHPPPPKKKNLLYSYRFPLAQQRPLVHQQLP